MKRTLLAAAVIVAAATPGAADVAAACCEGDERQPVVRQFPQRPTTTGTDWTWRSKIRITNDTRAWAQVDSTLLLRYRKFRYVPDTRKPVKCRDWPGPPKRVQCRRPKRLKWDRWRVHPDGIDIKKSMVLRPGQVRWHQGLANVRCNITPGRRTRWQVVNRIRSKRAFIPNFVRKSRVRHAICKRP